MTAAAGPVPVAPLSTVQPPAPAASATLAIVAGALGVLGWAACAALAWLQGGIGLVLGALVGAAATLAVSVAFATRQSARAGRVLAQLRRLEQGVLSDDQPLPGRDAFATLSQALVRLGASWSGIVADVRSSAALVEQAGEAMASGHRDLSGRTEQQAANLEQTAASVEELSSTVEQNARAVQVADGEAGRVRVATEREQAAMQEAVRSVGAIEQDTRRMRELVATIDGIAFQTNILALNASVEAARAGEQGRGFAVVAGEVRRLAQRCADEARHIRELIESTGHHVDDGVQRIGAAAGGIAEIVEGIRSMAGELSRIAVASAEQSQGLGQISQAVADLDGITQRNAQLVDEAASQADQLKERAATLSRSVAHFRLRQGTASEAHALVQRAVAAARGRAAADLVRHLTDPASGFHDRDMYVFALDAGGTYRAFGGNPAKVGTRVQDIPGVNGAALLAGIVHQADRQPGWVEYDIVNPQTQKVQTKMSYVTKVGQLYLGCGVYKSLARAA